MVRNNSINLYSKFNIINFTITGEFIGGCDILLEMHKTGDIVEELKKIGIESKAEKKE